MNTSTSKKSRLSSVLLAAVLTLTGSSALLLTFDEAQARERTATITGSAGQMTQRNVTHTPGNATSSTTGPNGNSSSRTTTRTTSGSQTTLTGPKGQTSTVNVNHS
ncbi:hypothetical protein [Pseudomonas sp. NA-150]|uniref:hypothetical protein n=1 Tax=Pseudomonas sp. NA-150 TaxID=3367525 RepID=UPI0037C76C34